MTPTWVVLLAAACGGSQNQVMQPSDDGVDPRMRRILELEEEISNAKQEMETLGEDCTNLCRLSIMVCEDSDQICLVSEDMREPDSRERCTRSKTDCSGQRTFATNRCGGCSGEPSVPGYAPPMD